ncbi:MAG: PIN domain-containing protein [Candidatus Bipolaricaulota bacterium]|nr:PIN domain-containing protein [Candidatus Bipolaricaulota bacterium]MDW8140684.1 PIN domain-containing protein [Candidatus Bipolaricaulota bacterium]
MNEYFVDTNVFLRFLTNDVPAQADAVARLLRQAAAGKINLHTSVLVIAELVWTLESYYELSREAIKTQVLTILHTPGLQVEDAHLIGSAILLYADRNIDFIDAYNACWMRERGLSRACTFDKKHFARVEGIVPLVPGA